MDILFIHMTAVFVSACVNLVYGHVNTCSNRFEYRHEILEALPHLKNCQLVHKVYPVCKEDTIVAYLLNPPYVIKGIHTDQPRGLLPDMLRLAMDVCCYGCNNITFIGPVDPKYKFTHKDGVALFMPLESATKSSVFFGHDYIPFIELSGVSIMSKEISGKTSEYTKQLLKAVLNIWPLFLTAILMAIVAGCVMWILDTWFNKDDFPRSFPRGPLEGFWWAFVSMTTVGYGDKAPKSFIARLFAIIWILVGITIFSMFTATLTSALNAKSRIFEDENFFNKTVGVLGNTAAGSSVVFQENAKRVTFSNVGEMASALRDGKVYALAMDDYTCKFHMAHLRKKVTGFKLHHRHSGTTNSYGVLSYKRNFSSFLRSFFKTNEDQRYTLVSTLAHWQHVNLQEPLKARTEFFDPDSSIFLMTIVGLLVVAFITIVIGLSCKYIIRRYKYLLEKYIDCFNLETDVTQFTINKGSRNVNDMEMEVEGNLNDFLNSFEELLSKWKNILHFSKEESLLLKERSPCNKEI